MLLLWGSWNRGRAGFRGKDLDEVSYLPLDFLTWCLSMVLTFGFSIFLQRILLSSPTSETRLISSLRCGVVWINLLVTTYNCICLILIHMGSWILIHIGSWLVVFFIIIETWYCVSYLQNITDCVSISLVRSTNCNHIFQIWLADLKRRYHATASNF